MTAYPMPGVERCRFCDVAAAADWLVDAVPWVVSVRECRACGCTQMVPCGEWTFSRKPDEVRT